MPLPSPHRYRRTARRTSTLSYTQHALRGWGSLHPTMTGPRCRTQRHMYGQYGERETPRSVYSPLSRRRSTWSNSTCYWSLSPRRVMSLMVSGWNVILWVPLSVCKLEIVALHIHCRSIWCVCVRACVRARACVRVRACVCACSCSMFWFVFS